MNIMIVRKAKKLKRLIIKFIKLMTINPHDVPLGYYRYKELSIGDLVQWSELANGLRDKSKKIGIVSELYIEHRGRREVAFAKEHELTKSKSNLTLLGKTREVLVMNLELLSKVSYKNGKISL